MSEPAAVPNPEPPARGKRIGGLLALVALAAVAIGAGWWWTHRKVPALPPVAATSPLQRVLVLPFAHGKDLPDAHAWAYDAHLLDALAATPGLAIVDGARADQALHQPSTMRAGQFDMAALHLLAAASRVLQPTLQHTPDGWRVQAQLHALDASPTAIDGPLAKTAPEAVREWLRAPAFRDAMRVSASPVLAMPDDDKALEAYGAGIDALRNGRLAPALQHLREATRATPGDPSAWLAQASAALAMGERNDAYDALETGLRTPAILKSPSPTALRLRTQLSAAQSLLDDEAGDAATQWRAVLASNADDTQAQLELARTLAANRDFRAAASTLQALTARDPGDPRAWFALGAVGMHDGQARRAVDEDFARALALYQRSGNLLGQAETQSALGEALASLGEPEEAAAQYGKAVELQRTLGNRRSVAGDLRELAGAMSLAGQYGDAEKHLKEARAIHESLDDPAGIAATDAALGRVAEARGDYPAALVAFRHALQSWHQAEDAHGTAETLDDIGFAQYQLGAYNDAQAQWQRASNVFETLEEDDGRIRTQQHLGMLATARGRWRQARTLLDAALVRAEASKSPGAIAASHRALAGLDLVQGHTAAAIEHATKAGDLFRQSEDRRGESDAGLLHVQALLAANAVPEARRVLATLGPSLKGASFEQQARADLATASIAAHDRKDVAVSLALRDANKTADKSGVQPLAIEVLLAHADAGEALDPRLDARTATLGNAGLRLRWLEHAMGAALAAKHREDAAALYREAMAWLRAGDYARAEALHRLGAQAAATPADASAANARADAARAAFLAAMPPALRTAAQ